MRLVTAEEMRAWDARTIAAGTPGHVLMERAGEAVARSARRLLRGRRGPAVIVCGPGNNGGDGFVVARRLRQGGRRVSVWLLGAADGVRGDAATMLARWRRRGGHVGSLDGARQMVAFAEACRRAGLIVDALFGTGLRAALEGTAAAAVDAMNAAGAPIVAIDVPSGVSADDGRILGVAIRAATTVTFGAAKVGLCVHPGCEFAGQVDVADIGLANPEPVGEAGVDLLEASTVGRQLPRRPAASHKGSFGHVLVVAGSRGKLGAALLAAEGAARAGAGLTTLAVPAALQPVAEGWVREVMTAAFADDGTGCAAMGAGGDLGALLERPTAVVCGPGLGQGPAVRSLVQGILERATVPVILDADALNAVAGTPLLAGRRGPVIVTPHPGEMARLIGASVAEVQQDRLATARRFAGTFGVVTVLKGARTVIAAPSGRAAIAPVGNPGLASGGSGDVLAGVVGAMLAQRLEPFEAATAAVYVHGDAADRVAARRGTIGMLARDVLDELPAAIDGLPRAPGPP